MAVDSYRNPIRPGRGTLTALQNATNQASFEDFELLFASDGDKLYVWNGTSLEELYSTTLSGKADLVGGKVDPTQIPDLAISEFLGEVADETARLALTGERGDWALQTDLGLVYVLVADGGSAGADWRSLSYPAAAVASVNGQVGAVVLDKSSVGLGNVDNTSDVNKPVSTAQQTAIDQAEADAESAAAAANDALQITLQGNIDLKADIASPAFTGNPTAPTPTAGDNDTSLATTAFVTDAVGTAITNLGDTVTEAPQDGTAYVRVDGAWVSLVSVLTTLGDNNEIT